MTIKLNNEKFSEEDRVELSEWIKSNSQFTQGDLCKKFEEEFSKYIGCSYSVFVNSGSSANLLAIAYLSRKNKYTGRNIIVPAVSWATDYSPIVQLGFNPILVDCNLKDLTSDLSDLEQVFQTYQPLAYLHVSVLGQPGNLTEIKYLCEKYNVILIEDNCESLGTKYNGIMIGSFGLMSTYSFYYSHHISTIEGGMICTNDRYIYNILRMLREHGWARRCEKWYQKSLSFKEKDNQFTFYEYGFNVRNTEIAAFIGLQQLNKFANKTYKRVYHEIDEPSYRHENLYQFKLSSSSNLVSSFGIPVLVKDVELAKDKLIGKGIESRPIIAGSMQFQPMVKNSRNCPNAEIVNKHGLYLPNHVGIKVEDIKTYSECLRNNIWLE